MITIRMDGEISSGCNAAITAAFAGNKLGSLFQAINAGFVRPLEDDTFAPEDFDYIARSVFGWDRQPSHEQLRDLALAFGFVERRYFPSGPSHRLGNYATGTKLDSWQWGDAKLARGGFEGLYI